jgi:hypothetical protein
MRELPQERHQVSVTARGNTIEVGGVARFISQVIRQKFGEASVDRKPAPACADQQAGFHLDVVSTLCRCWRMPQPVEECGQVIRSAPRRRRTDAWARTHAGRN